MFLFAYFDYYIFTLAKQQVEHHLHRIYYLLSVMFASKYLK